MPVCFPQGAQGTLADGSVARRTGRGVNPGRPSARPRAGNPRPRAVRPGSEPCAIGNDRDRVRGRHGSGCRSAPRGRRAEHIGAPGFFRSDPTVDSRARDSPRAFRQARRSKEGYPAGDARGLARSLDGGTGRSRRRREARGERRGGDDWVCSGAGRDGPFGGPGEIGTTARRLGTGGLRASSRRRMDGRRRRFRRPSSEGRGAHACRKRPLGRPRALGGGVSEVCEGGARRLASAGPGTSLVDRG